MGGGEGDELAGGDDFGLFPEWGEVAGVAGDEVIGAGGGGGDARGREKRNAEVTEGPQSSQRREEGRR
jgi:hypothetical protein